MFEHGNFQRILEEDVADAKEVLDQAIKAKFDAEDWAKQCQEKYIKLVGELQTMRAVNLTK